MANVFQALQEVLKGGEKAVLITRLDNHTKDFYISDGSCNGKTDLWAEKALRQRRPLFLPSLTAGPLLLEPIFPPSRLLILGAGHVALSLVQLAAMLQWHTTVVDDRKQYADPARFPAVSKVICAPFKEALAEIETTPETFVVVATRGHIHDMLCLQALAAQPKSATYYGLLTSQGRWLNLKRQLGARGVSEPWLDKLSAPIGLSIGATSAAEIAVAIMAEMIAVKRKGATDSNMGQKTPYPEFAPNLLAYLALPQTAPLAIATVIDTRGSVPQRAGAKMLVCADGRILGSVGGGWGEAKVIETALNLLKSGGHQLLHLDFSESPAHAPQDMVCGGGMDILIEIYKGG